MRDLLRSAHTNTVTGERPDLPDTNTTDLNVPIEDIDLFAKGLYRARGMAARKMAMDRAHGYLSVGDEEGHKVWRAVADRMTRFRDTARD